jgi:hypothetical protein
MLSEFKKSTNNILYERVTSPFYGTLVLAWIIWNWKIIYLTFFISESKIDSSKIDYIIAHYSDVNHLVYYPIISTVLIITIFPFLSNGAYWLHLKFRKWKIDSKNKIEDKQLLTLEQSIIIRKELRDKEKEFEELLSNKDLEIKTLSKELENISNVNSEEPKKEQENTTSYENDYRRFKNDSYAFKNFSKIAKQLRKNYTFPSDTSEDIIEYYELNDIVNKSSSLYVLTGKGNAYYKLYFNENFKNNK